MSERLPVAVSFFGEPFDREAVIHTLRHLAMRRGWTLRPQAEHRLIYATTEGPKGIPAGEGDLVVLSSQDVRRHTTEGMSPVPLKGNGKYVLPFFHPGAKAAHPGWIHADVIAGAHALLNLHYERINIPEGRDGWIRFTEDWWSRAGFAQPVALADLWLDTIASQAEKIGWPAANAGSNISRGTVVLTHDVDYMPTNSNRGFPRFLRTVLRQALTRRNIGQAWQTQVQQGLFSAGALQCPRIHCGRRSRAGGGIVFSIYGQTAA